MTAWDGIERPTPAFSGPVVSKSYLVEFYLGCFDYCISFGAIHWNHNGTVDPASSPVFASAKPPSVLDRKHELRRWVMFGVSWLECGTRLAYIPAARRSARLPNGALPDRCFPLRRWEPLAPFTVCRPKMHAASASGMGGASCATLWPQSDGCVPA